MSKFFARLGTAATIKAKAKEVSDNGGKVERDDVAGTIEASFDGETIFKGIRKGAKGEPWIILYSRDFYGSGE